MLRVLLYIIPQPQAFGEGAVVDDCRGLEVSEAVTDGWGIFVGEEVCRGGWGDGLGIVIT